MNCYACETKVRPGNGVLVGTIYDHEGTAILLHRVCLLRIVDRMPEEMAGAIHHQIVSQRVWADADAAVRERKDGEFKRPMWSMTAFSADELMTAEPTVPQHPIGYVPPDE